MIPDNSLSSVVISADFVHPPDQRERFNLKDYELGGVALNDPSQGQEVQEWTLTYVGGDVLLTPENTGIPIVAFTLADVTEITLAFDQNMNGFIAYVALGQAYYFWFDPTPAQYVHQIMDVDVKNPRCCLDDKRDSQVTSSDIILAYTRGTTLYYREERDRYEVEYMLHDFSPDPLPGTLDTVGMNKKGRLQFMFVSEAVQTDPGDDLDIVLDFQCPGIQESLQTGWFDLSQFQTFTFEEVFGVPVYGEDFTQVIPVGYNISVHSVQDDIRIYIVDSLDANEVIALVVGVNGNVSGSLHYQGYPLPQDAYLSLQKNLDQFIVIASDTGNARIRKQNHSLQDLTPLEMDSVPLTKLTIQTDLQASIGLESDPNTVYSIPITDLIVSTGLPIIYSVPVADLDLVSGSEPFDSDFADVTLLLHMNGADASTVFPDHSIKEHVVTPVADAQVDTGEFKFGGASLLLDGTLDGLTIPYVNADFDWWIEDFTIEFWVNASSFASGWTANTAPTLMGRKTLTGNTNYWSFGPMNGGTLAFYYYNGGGVAVESTATIDTDEQVHCAMCQIGGDILLFIGGVLDSTTAIIGTPQSVSQDFTIGGYFGGYAAGHIDDVRITRGVARYTANFTPPTQEHPNIAVGNLPATGLEFALDATKEETLFSDIAKTTESGEGGDIAVWEDISGQGNDWIQATPSLQPTYELSNGRIHFNSHHLNGPDISSWTEGAFIARFQSVLSNTLNGHWGSTAWSSSNSGNHWAASGTSCLNCFGVNDRGSFLWSSVSAAANDLLTIESNVDTGLNVQQYVDGELAHDAVVGTILAFDTNPIIGALIRSNVPQFYINGYYHKFCGYNLVPTATDREVINHWLKS